MRKWSFDAPQGSFQGTRNEPPQIHNKREVLKMEIVLQGCSFQEVKQKAIKIYQNSESILDFRITHKRDADVWIIKFHIPNQPFISKFMLDKSK